MVAEIYTARGIKSEDVVWCIVGAKIPPHMPAVIIMTTLRMLRGSKADNSAWHLVSD